MPVTEMLVDKQSNVAITIQIEYSYFSGTNLSFLTYGNLLLATHSPSPLTHSRQATAFWVNYWSSGGSGVFLARMPCSRSAGRFRWSSWWQCSRNSALPSGPLPPGSVCLAEVLLHTESPVERTQNQWSASHSTSTGFYVSTEIT